MSKKKGSYTSGIVYSTNPDFKFEELNEEPATLAPKEQRLKIMADTKHRAGKIVTLVEGFTGTSKDLEAMGKMLKTQCGTGGSVKDGMIIIQGNYVDRIKSILQKQGYKV
jgi:translation initiation factor 1